MLEGAEWTVEECHPQSGRVALRVQYVDGLGELTGPPEARPRHR
jgi:hypothetical protein